MWIMDPAENGCLQQLAEHEQAPITCLTMIHMTLADRSALATPNEDAFVSTKAAWHHLHSQKLLPSGKLT
jgi:hypothetical protein